MIRKGGRGKRENKGMRRIQREDNVKKRRHSNESIPNATALTLGATVSSS